MTRLENPVVCQCGHYLDIHVNTHNCGRHCKCQKFVPNSERSANLSVTLPADLLYRFKNHVMLRHGVRKGGLSLEVEYALRKCLGDVKEPELHSEWKENNR